MVIKNVVMIHIRGKPTHIGNVYGDTTGKFKDGHIVALPPIINMWNDKSGNTFAISNTGTVYQIELWSEEKK